MTTKQWEARQKREIMKDIKERVTLVKELRKQLEVSNDNYANRELMLDITSNQTQIIKLANSLFPQEHLYKTSLGFKTIHDYALKIKIKYTRSTFIGENNDYNEGVKWEEGEFLVTNDYYLYRCTSEGRSSEKFRIYDTDR